MARRGQAEWPPRAPFIFMELQVTLTEMAAVRESKNEKTSVMLNEKNLK